MLLSGTDARSGRRVETKKDNSVASLIFISSVHFFTALYQFKMTFPDNENIQGLRAFTPTDPRELDQGRILQWMFQTCSVCFSPELF